MHRLIHFLFTLSFILFSMKAFANVPFEKSPLYNITERIPFGEGVHIFSNLYYNNCTFLIAQRIDQKNIHPLNFLGEGDYIYSTKNLTHFEQNAYIQSDSYFKIPGTTLIFAASEQMKVFQHHYFHFLEEFILAYSALCSLKCPQVTTVIFPSIDHWEGVNRITSDILNAIFPGVKILNKSQFAHLTQCNLSHFENAIVVDRSGCCKNEMVCKYNKANIGHLDLIHLNDIRKMRNCLWDRLNTYNQPHRKTTITYIKRNKGRRRLNAFLEKLMLMTLRHQFPECLIQEVSFENYPYSEQVQMIRNTDILLGVHGNGLTHSFLLPDNSLTLEFFPEKSFRTDYQLVNKLAGHKYFALAAKEGVISDHANLMLPYGEVNQRISRLDLISIVKIIKTHLTNTTIHSSNG